MRISARRRTWQRCMGAMMLVALASGKQASADYASTVLGDAPLGYWRFNDSNDVAKNLGTGGTALDGAYVNAPRVAVGTPTLVNGSVVNGLGAGNTAIQIGDNGDGYVQIPDSILSDQSAFTMSAWIAPGARTGNRIGIFGQNDAVEFGFISPNQIQLWTPAGQVLNYTIDPVNQIPEDTWLHLATVANGENIRLFINGQPTTAGASYGSSSFNFNIGGGGIYDATGNQFTGTIDEVGVWDKALSEATLKAQVTAAKTAGGNYASTTIGSGPIAYYNFDQTGGIAVNQITTSVGTDGVWTGGTQTAQGPNEVYPGFGATNKALEVSAPDDGFVSVPKSLLSGLSNFTLSGWIKPGDFTDTRVGLFGQNDAMEFGFINPTTIQMWTPDGGYVDFPLTDEVTPGQWVHVAAVGDGTEIRVYVDGDLMATGGSPLIGNPIDTYGASDFPFNIGGGGVYDGTGNQFTGKIDEVAVWDRALTDQQIAAHYQAGIGGVVLVGDFNTNGQLDAGDLDLLAASMVAHSGARDLDGDADTDIEDRRLWVNNLKHTYMGDSNLDGEFNSTDFVQIFSAGKFEGNALATWNEGDWNGDQRFDTSDFVEAFQGGGFEIGPRAAVSAVPEPSSLSLFALGVLATIRRRRLIGR